MNARPRFKLMSLSLLIVLLFSGFITTRQVCANSSVNVEISTFHDALAPYGNWVNHPLYGQVWYPRNVVQGWRPYTDGYWAHTDDYGWLWVSYEPWGWAPFHYGRWAWDNWYGWVWVPGRTWAPAWVFWRSGGGYAAWAPMPPNVVWQPGVGLNISYFNYDRDLRWDSWVAVREYDLPNRHISRHISPPSQNRQVINVTNYTNNVTLINNTIVNQGVPVKQIEEVTRRPVESVVPKVHDRVNINTAEHQDGQPDIIRLPMAAPTHEEIQHNEELARRLDGKNADGTRAELPVADVGQSGNQASRLPGRLVGAPAPVQSPYATPEHINPALTEPIEQTLPQPAIPKTPLVGLSLDPDPQQHKEPKVGSHQEALVPTQRSDQQSSATTQPIAPASPQVDSVSATDQKSVSTDAAMLPLQNERQPSESARRVGNRTLQDRVADQQPIESQQTENLQRQQKIDQLQQELARRQDKQKQQEAVIQQQQVERAVAPVQQIQQQEPTTHQPEMQNQPQIQPQPTERAVEPVPQIQQQESARQPEMQNQPQEMQPQQVDHAVEPAQQIQQQEPTHQPEMQNQPQIQPQSAERAVEPVPQIQQQESARQPEIQNQPQEMQSKQVDHAVAPAQQMQQQESARQQEQQNQQQVEMQQQQAERARAEAQQMQQQESARQQEQQNHQQVEVQQQQAERARAEAQQMQQQESARQQEQQNQQQVEVQQQQAERARAEAQQIQQQESARQQKIDGQRQPSEGARSDSPEINRQQKAIPQ
jgi:hypothetical protein